MKVREKGCCGKKKRDRDQRQKKSGKNLVQGCDRNGLAQVPTGSEFLGGCACCGECESASLLSL